MLRRLRSAAVSAALVLPPLIVPAYSSANPAGPRGDTGPLLAVVGRGDLWLVNRGERPVQLFAIDREALASVGWVPCVDPVRCPPVVPGATRAVPFGAGELSLRQGREASVFWWYATHSAEGPRADEVHRFVVRL